MPKYIISWDAGYGKDHEVIQAPNDTLANDAAYDRWREAAENDADYEARPYSKELAVDLELEEAE